MISASVRGNVGNVELKALPSGDPVLEFSLASNDKIKGVESTTWVRCAVFGKRAEALAKVIEKGTSLLVVGPLSVRTYDGKNGKGFSVEVKVDQLDFCGGGKAESGGGYSRGGAPKHARGDADESGIPEAFQGDDLPY